MTTHRVTKNEAGQLFSVVRIDMSGPTNVVVALPITGAKVRGTDVVQLKVAALTEAVRLPGAKVEQRALSIAEVRAEMARRPPRPTLSLGPVDDELLRLVGKAVRA